MSHEASSILDLIRSVGGLIVVKLDRMGGHPRGRSQPRARIGRKRSKRPGTGAAIETGGAEGPHGPRLAVLGMVAEMELGFIRDRQRAGIDAAKTKGVYRGRHAARSVLWRCKQSRGCYAPGAVYAPVARTLTRKQTGSRYILVGVRTLVDPNIPGDIETVHALQDGVKIEQREDPASSKSPGATREPEEGARRSDRTGYNPRRHKPRFRVGERG